MPSDAAPCSNSEDHADGDDAGEAILEVHGGLEFAAFRRRVAVQHPCVERREEERREEREQAESVRKTAHSGAAAMARRTRAGFASTKAGNRAGPPGANAITSENTVIAAPATGTQPSSMRLRSRNEATAETGGHAKRGGRHVERGQRAEALAAAGEDFREFHRPEIDEGGESPEEGDAERGLPQRSVAPEVGEVHEMADGGLRA